MKKNLSASFLKSCGLATISILFHLKLYSQSIPSDAFVSMQPTATAGVVSGLYYVEVQDTSDVSQIEIKLGTTYGGDEYVSQIINYDGSGLPSGYSFSRSGNMITIAFGNLSVDAAYYGQVRLKDNSGAWSSYYAFVSN